jgi:O-antigen/teichoic acid export membrane protein
MIRYKLYLTRIDRFLTSSTTKTASLAIFFGLSNFALNYIINFVLARALGVVDYGLYSTIIAILTIVSLLILLGFDDAVLNFIPDYLKKQNYPAIHGYLGHALKHCVVPVTLCFFIGLCLVALFKNATFMIHARHDPVLYYLWAIPVVAGFNFICNYVDASGAGNFSLFLRTILPLMLMLAVLLIMTYLGAALTVAEITWLYIFTVMFTFLIGLFWSYRSSIKVALNVRPNYAAANKWGATAWQMLVLTFAIGTFTEIAITTAHFFDPNPTASGIFSAISIIIGLMWAIQTALQAIFAPQFSALIAQNKLVRTTLRQAIIATFIPATMVLAIVIFLGKDILALFGQEFVRGYLSLCIVAVVSYLSVLVAPIYWCVQYSNGLPLLTKGIVIILLSYIPIVIIMAHFEGLLGTTLAYSAANLALDVYVLVLIREKFLIVLFRGAKSAAPN